jgi:hypothetical protein
MAVSELLFSMSSNFLNEDGKEQGMFMAFITEDNDVRIEHSERETTLSDAEIAALEHPIWMPHMAKDNLHLHPGDTFTAVFGSRKFVFTVAGFYDTLLLDNTVHLRMWRYATVSWRTTIIRGRAVKNWQRNA